MLLGHVWPAYLFALPLVVRGWGLVHMRRDGTLHTDLTIVEEAVTVVFLSLVVVLFLVRRRGVRGGHAALVPGLVALVATFLLNVVGYLHVEDTTSSAALLASSAFVLVGTLWAMWSLAILGRCFGLLPEVRGLVTRGPYRLVRHPVYLGEIVSAIGLLLAKPNVAIALLFLMFVCLQYWRTIFEERALASAFPDTYPAYARRVGRLVPAMRRNVWLLAVIVLALLIGELPHVLAACCAPAGATGFGTAWFVDDFAQYESAMRQGADQSGWLVHDPFTTEAHPAALMFPLYVGIGKLAAAVNAPAPLLEQLLEILARVLLVLALWRFCRAFASGKTAARWALGLALFASGFELIAGLFGGYSGSWSYEMNGLGLLFAAPHVPLAMAATLELARALLRLRHATTPTWLVKVAVLSAAIALLLPFHLPVLLSAAVVTGYSFWLTRHGLANLIGALVAVAVAVPILLPTIATFSFQSFWDATYTTQNLLPSPAPHELLVDLGPTLVLALFGALRGRVAPFGLVLWLLLSLMAMYLPVPYQRRLSFGIEPMVAVLAANSLVAYVRRVTPGWAAAARLITLAVAASGTALVLVGVVDSGLRNAPQPVYRSTTDLDAAAAWLDTRATSNDVIVADWDASNYLAARTPAHMYGGHPVATLHADQKRFAIATVFAHQGSLAVARQIGAQWLVYGPGEAGIPSPPDPDFESGAVKVYRVG